jgi:hypothetical protein
LVAVADDAAARTAYDRPVATRGAAGDYALIYIANGHNIRVRMDRLAPPAMSAFWFNPRNGRWRVGDTENDLPRPFASGLPAGTEAPIREFTPAGGERGGNDWVLLLKRGCA